MKITRLIINLSDEGGNTIDTAALVTTAAQERKFRAAAALLNLSVQASKVLSPGERLYSGRHSRGCDFCFKLLTAEEMKRFLDSDAIDALKSEGEYHDEGVSSSAAIQFVGTAAEVLAKAKA